MIDVMSRLMPRCVWERVVHRAPHPPRVSIRNVHPVPCAHSEVLIADLLCARCCSGYCDVRKSKGINKELARRSPVLVWVAGR